MRTPTPIWLVWLLRSGIEWTLFVHSLSSWEAKLETVPARPHDHLAQNDPICSILSRAKRVGSPANPPHQRPQSPKALAHTLKINPLCLSGGGPTDLPLCLYCYTQIQVTILVDLHKVYFVVFIIKWQLNICPFWTSSFQRLMLLGHQLKITVAIISVHNKHTKAS